MRLPNCRVVVRRMVGRITDRLSRLLTVQPVSRSRRVRGGEIPRWRRLAVVDYGPVVGADGDAFRPAERRCDRIEERAIGELKSAVERPGDPTLPANGRADADDVVARIGFDWRAHARFPRIARW